MIVGIPRESREGERRVALLPGAVQELTAAGHEVRVETGAGAGIGVADEEYRIAGARVGNVAQAWDADLVVKVKEMQEAELRAAPRERTIFSFHHLPGVPDRARALAERGDTAIAFEMVQGRAGYFPLLAPMSAIAGRMAIDVATAARGEPPRSVLVLGAGHAGMSAARAAKRVRAKTMILTRSRDSLEAARDQGFSKVDLATPENVAAHVPEADLVVGAVFVPAQPTPKLLPRALVRRMKPGAMIVDISIDAGGVAETSRPTTHAEPTYVEEGVLHYAVPNMPAALPAEGAAAISVAALPFVRALAAKGIARALLEDAGLRAGVLLWHGRVNHAGIAQEAGLPYTPLSDEDLA